MMKEHPFQAGTSHYAVDDILPQLKAAILTHGAAVLSAAPGSGKTTRVPLALMDIIDPGSGRILMLEPRRIAATSAAGWMAKTLGEEIGRTLGYSIRLESRVSKATRIELMTEGILPKRILAHPDLSDVAMVIFDEFHERTLQADLALALCLDIRRSLRPDLKIVVMSATLDTQAVSALLGGAPIIKAQGHAYPVEERYLGDNRDEPLTVRVHNAVHRAIRETEGDILVFLPGSGEIRAVSDALKKSLQKCPVHEAISTHPLYGDLPFEEQERAILPSLSRKIILATNIAETSLTIEGVRVVIDGGLTRRLQYDAGSGMNRLMTVNVSQASAHQRRGRAGRTEPGVCYRLYSRHTFQSLIAFHPPEIAISDLSPLVLDVAAWGVTDSAALPWLDPPPPAAWRSAQSLLKDLGALDRQGFITQKGRMMSRLPVHPRLACLLLKAEKLHCPLLGADLASLLSERDIVRFPEAPLRPRGVGLDLTDRIEILQRWRKEKRIDGTDPAVLRTVDLVARQFRHFMEKGEDKKDQTIDGVVERLLLSAFPDRIAQRRKGSKDRCILQQGRGVKVSEKTRLTGSPYLIAASLDRGEGSEGIIHIAQSIPEQVMREELADQIKTRRRVEWNKQEGRLIAVSEEYLGAVILSAKPLSPSDDEAVLLLCEAIRSRNVSLDFNRKVRTFQARVLLMRDVFPEESWPVLSENWLVDHPEKWLKPWLSGITTANQLEALDILPALHRILSFEKMKLLDDRAPEKIRVPSGHTVSIDYISGDRPILAVKLQEMFGWTQSPVIAEGRVQLKLQLLSPAGRPLAVTSDLNQFWNTGYPQVRKEMKGRYPKHPWPENPWSALPTRKAKTQTK
jgi:ATP-dependent helicase HrpB